MYTTSKTNRKVLLIKRKIIREYARIQTFHDNYDFIRRIASKYKQIRNAVPVNLPYKLGECIQKCLFNLVI